MSNISDINEKKYVRIYADNVKSNIDDFEFSWKYICQGGKKSPTYLNLKKAVFMSDGQPIERKFERYEVKYSGLVLARLAIQVFEDDIKNLSENERKSFNTDGSDKIIGFWEDRAALLKEWGNTENAGKTPARKYEADMYLSNGYPSNKNGIFYFFNAGLFDSIIMAQNLLKEFGKQEQYFEITVTQKKHDPEIDKHDTTEEKEKSAPEYQNEYTSTVIDSKNIIFRGAPGTGKTYLAREIAVDIVSEGTTVDYEELNDEQKEQIEFVQFHPSYDYTDFVEGLRPKTNEDGTMEFELQDGIFKRFVSRARDSFNKGIDNFEESWDKLVEKLDENGFLEIPNKTKGTFQIELNELGTGLATRTYSGEYGKSEWITGKSRFYNKKQLYNIYRGLRGVPAKGHDNYRKSILQYMKENFGLQEFSFAESKCAKPFVFIIDEINRGEISKIFGELFFSLDPGYRGKAGEVSTQYANLHEQPDERFFIPDNVYIIGTMNDIDRSVDSFDFAMRRRFRFIEIKAEDRRGMLEFLDAAKRDDAISRLSALNKAISDVDELNENYHIGASYFLKLETIDFDQLWTDYLSQLLQDYVRGMYDEESIMENFKKSYYNAGETDNG